MSLDLGRAHTSAGSDLAADPDAPRLTGDLSTGDLTLHEEPRIAAVLLVRSDEHLPDVLAGLQAQRRRPDAVVLVDARPQRDQEDLSATLPPGSYYLPTRPGTGLNAAVQLALRALDDDPVQTDWLWLLDDTDRPAMKALAHQVARIKQSGNVGAVGVKHRGGQDGAALLDVGLRPGPFGTRHTLVEPGERDQGQRDHLCDVYAVPLSGLLIRRDLWARLGGLDPALPAAAGADLDLGRRIRLTGHRVEVAPRAVFTRPCGQDRPEPRRSRAHRRLTWCPLPALPVVAVLLLLEGLLALPATLLAKRPDDGLATLGAHLYALLRVDRVIGSRWRARRTRTIPRRRLAPLRIGWRSALAWRRDQARAAAPRLVSPAGAPAQPGAWRWAVAVLALCAAVSGGGLLRLFGPGPLSSQFTPDLPTTVVDVGRTALDTWVPTGLGAPGPPDAFLLILTVLGALTGSVRLSVAVLVIGALPLAAWSAWWSAGALTRRPRLRALAALLWAGSPVLLLTVGNGRLGLLVAALLLPVLGRLVGQAISAAHARGAWAWGAAAALVLVPIATGSPVLLLAAVPAFVLLALRARCAALLYVPVPALAVLAPTIAALLDRPSWSMAQPLDPVAVIDPPRWAILLGWPVPGPGLLPAPVTDLAGLTEPWLGGTGAAILVQVLVWGLGAAPLILATTMLWRVTGGSGRALVLRAGWLVAALGAGLAWVCGQLVVGYHAGVAVHADAFPGTLLIVLGLIVAAVSGLGAPARPATTRPARVRRGLRATGIVAAALLPALALTGWAGLQLFAAPAGDLHRGAQQELSALTVDDATSPAQTRTLLLAVDSTADGDATGDTLPPLTLSLVRGDGPRVDRRSAMDSLTERTADPGTNALRTAVVTALAGDQDPREALAPFGIGSVVLLPGHNPTATDQLAARLDSRPGIVVAGESDGARTWRLTPLDEEADAPGEPAAVRLLDPSGSWVTVPSRNGRVDTAVDTSGGTLVLAERSARGWHATLDGRPLPAVDAGWQQAFELPPGDGHLEISYESRWHQPWLIGTASLLALTLLLALPTGRRHEDEDLT